MNNREKNTDLGDYIRTRRLARNLSVTQAAEAADLHQSYWRRLEAGDYQSPDPRLLPAIADVLECELADLYTSAGYTPGTSLPSFSPYLRSRYPSLPAEAVRDLEKWFDLQRAYYDIPDGQPVYPPLPKDERPKGSPSPEAKNKSTHAWRSGATKRNAA